MILVDDLKSYPGKRDLWCHMISDTSKTELLTFARLLGVGVGYYDGNPRHPHFDIKSEQQRVALTFGAELVSSQEIVKRNYTQRRRNEPALTCPTGSDL